MALGNWEFNLDGVQVTQQGNVRLRDFDPGTLNVLSQDQDSPVDEERLFGRDRAEAPVWKLDLHLLGDPHAQVALLQAKAAPRVPLAPGVHQTITYRVGGRERLIYGRLRNFTPKPRLGSPDRVVDASILIYLADQYSYDTTQRSVLMRLQPAATGGFIPPFTAPIITVGDGEVQGVIDAVGGSAPAPFTAVFRGPIQNPWLRGDGWEVRMATGLTEGQTATLDTRRKTLLRNDGASLGGTLGRFSRLSGLRLTPGPDRLTFGGIDSTGTATCTVTWRPTHYGY